MNLNRLTATEIVQSIASGRSTAEALMIDCLGRIRERDSAIGAFTVMDEDLALTRAHTADRASKLGPLHGVPFVVKDIIDTKDFPTSWGTPIYKNRRPSRNAACVQQLIRAGAIPIGKTVTTEFACFTPGKTVNPLIQRAPRAVRRAGRPRRLPMASRLWVSGHRPRHH